jgi:hypothetical protein
MEIGACDITCFYSFFKRKDVGSAFKFLRKACERGIPQFDTLMNYFKDNFSALKLLFIKAEEGYSYIDEEIINLHNVECVEMARKYKVLFVQFLFLN